MGVYMLIFKDDYIIAIPKYMGTEMHRHAMQHIIISEEPIILYTEGKRYTNDNICVIGSNIEHKVETKTVESIVLLVDTSTALAEGIRQKWLSSNNISMMNKPIKLFLSEKSETQIVSAVELILDEIGIVRKHNIVIDDRIISVIDEVQSGRLLFKTVPEIASIFAISVSRLEHLFMQNTGMRLKNYMLMIKLKMAYQIIAQGESITEAAMNAGFSDSAHLAATAKKTTGISISQFFSSHK